MWIWKVEDESLFIFCNIDQNIPAGSYSLNFYETPAINYKNYLVLIEQRDALEFEKLGTDIIDLYSEKQTIIVERDKFSYELRFKISSYNNQAIMINCILPYCS